MRTTTYRGYKIRHGRGLEWFAHIYRPSSPLIMTDGVVTASLGEGEAVALERAKARIDAEEKKSR